MHEKGILHQFDSIVKSFSKRDKIALIHDLDADGVSSGVIVYNSLKLLRGKAPDLVVTQSFKTVELLPKTISLLKKKKISKVIVVDFALDQQPESVKMTENLVDQILVIDHHKSYGKPGKKTFFLKAQLVSDLEPSTYPTSKLAFDLFSRHVNLEKWSWIACVGLIGDNQLEQWRGFIGRCAKDHDSSVEEFTQIMNIISAVEVLAPEKLNGLLKFYASCSSPRQMLSSRYAPYAEKLESEMASLMKKFEKEKQVFPDAQLVWFEFNAKHNIKSAIINSVSNESYPHYTVVFVQGKGDGFVSFSARRQDFKVKMNDILENAVKGFENAGAGGHVPAAAGRCKKKDLPELKRRIIRLLSGPPLKA